ncbi:hypothetical protein [Fluviicola sp.]|jgi:hypothetical protein|uniref:hypothetical protein n=1 Tax=Fluviicola sp. TaxID=1917219 RepID=UPI002828110A|nr:hypothetical protein [Fluviicola sp.]MDR0801313.1 hypothetical protein [Fluviicola sp.]
MNRTNYILFAGFFLTLNACVLDEAKQSIHEKVVFYTDTYCPADSTIIQEFEQSRHISVQIVYQPQKEIAKLIQKNKFNTGIDVLLITSDSLRENLYNQGLFSQLKGRTAFRNINRQFNNNHHFWVPLCHNPLVLTTKKDSSITCIPLNWNKLNKDSTHPKIEIQSNVSSYLVKLSETDKFSWINRNLKAISSYRIYTLDQLAKLSEVNFRFNQNNCFYYLFENQKFITNFTSISLYKYSRNKVASQQFIEFYSRYQYQVASNRNQLSTFKTIQPNFLIRTLEIQ